MNAHRSCFRRFCSAGCVAVCFGFLALAGSAQTPAPPIHHPARATSMAAAPGAAAAPQMKGVWEPMNYPDDISLQSVFFVNDRVGWIAAKGSGGAIMYTADGGAHWEFQMGDPHGSDPGISDLQFLDATHGWAYQYGGQLLRTTDGKTWETVGLVPSSSVAQYRFVSAQVGFAISGDYTGSAIYTTHDGGRTWTRVFNCTTTLQVNGLTRNVGCYLSDIYFPSAKVGYAVGGGYNDAWSAFVKTDDGGKTWRVIFASTEVDQADNVFFTDENNGMVRVRGDRTVITDDGGQTWRGATGNTKGVFKFGDPEVGWSCVEGYAPSCSISVDGGKSWTTHDFNLPSDFSDFSVPRRDLLYAVGDHGMIYRYRVVPSTYTAQGAVNAPAVPTYGGPIVGQLQQMQNQVAALQTQLGGAPTAASSAPAASGGFSQSASAQSSAGDSLGNQVAPASGGSSQSASGGGFSQGSSDQSNAAPAAASADSSASSGGFSQDASATSSAAPAGQDASASGGFSQDASAGGATQDPTATATGFSQDASAAPTSQFVQTTCASAVQSLQTIFTSVVTMIPQFGTQFKNLNNVFAGLNMLASMMSSANQIKNDFVALKKATSAQTALAALADLSKTLQSMSQSINTQFSSLTSAPASGGAGGAIGNQMGGAIGNQMGGAPATSSSGAAASSVQPASSAQTPAASTTQSSTSSGAVNTAHKVKAKIPPF